MSQAPRPLTRRFASDRDLFRLKTNLRFGLGLLAAALELIA